jgi:AcrR family transcriptional regulator
MERTFQRARQPAQKEQRRLHLLETARALLESGTGLQELTLNGLAREARMAKANVYRYFESREGVLLELLWGEWSRWFRRFSRRGRRPRDLSLRDLVTALTRSLCQERLLCALTAALPGVIEQNLRDDTIRDFKLRCITFFGEVATFLEGCCATLEKAHYASLVLDIAHAIMGLYPATHAAPAVARVLEAADMRFFRRDFGDELERFALALAMDHERTLVSGRR